MSEIECTTLSAPQAAVNNRRGVILQRVIAGIFLGLGAYVAIKALELPYYTPVGPGPAFFPFWLGLALCGLSATVLATSFAARKLAVFDERIVPQRAALIQMGATFGMIAFFALTIQSLGFVISIFAVLLVLQLVNRVGLVTALLISTGGSLGVGYAFSNWLGVYVPVAPHGWLQAIGL